MDYETIINCFVAVFEHYKKDEQKVFVICDKRDDFADLVKFLNDCVKNKQWHISFNGLAFDAQITHWILDKQAKLATFSTEDRVTAIYNYAQSVINKTDRNEFQDYPPFKMKIKQIDLFKMNHWDNKAKMSGLKWVQYSMDWENVEEMPHPHYQHVVSDDTLNDVVLYCINDVRSTKSVLNYSKEQISLRQTLTREYNIDLYSASEPKISKELFLYFLEKKTGIHKSELKQMRTPRQYIVLAEVILPYVQFKTPEFQSVLEFFRKKVIVSTKDGFKHTVSYKGVKTDYGLGGIHGAADAGVYEAAQGWTIMTSDVTSFYPNLAIKNGFHPAHLPKKEFGELYEWFFEERKKIPKSDPKNYVYKIILNSTYGLTGDENSFLYDPRMTMQITINGQLLLSMLYEMICEEIPEARPLMQNTDGLETMIPADKVEKYMEICARWEQLTQLSLEHDEYRKMIIRDVNNYIAISKNGKVKCKGAFEWEDLDKKKVATFHKNKSFLVIPKAIYEYFVNGVKPEDYLDQNQNIFDYCAGAKAKGAWNLQNFELVSEVLDEYKAYTKEQKINYLKANGWVESWAAENWVHTSWANQEAYAGLSTDKAFFSSVRKEGVFKKTKLQKIVRYFVSKNGSKIVKCHPDGREIQLESGSWLQQVINKIDPNKPFTEYPINKEYYLEEIYKQIDQLEKTIRGSFTQLSLF